MGRNLNFFDSVPSGAAPGSDVLFTPFITLTAAHLLRINNENSSNSLSYIGAVPDGAGDYNAFNGIFESEDSRFSSEYREDSYASDYGVLRSATPFNFPFTIDIDINNTYPRTINVLGYPRDSIGMHKGTATSKYDPNFACTGDRGTIYYQLNTSIGMSGGPIFDSNNNYTTGIHNYSCTVDGIKYGNGIPFTDGVVNEILNWVWSPTGIIDLQYPEPNIDINLVAIESFTANFDTFTKMDINGNLEIRGNDFNNLIKWESSKNGYIGQGGIISSDVLKNTLTSGNHRITAKIDSNGESGEKNINITIIRPTGRFTSPNSCIVDLTNSPNNTCSINIKWTVADTPETSVVWNATANSQFAAGNSGTKAFAATTSNTRFELYPSDQRKILLATANVSAKVPTGNLTNNTTVCSLQPTPLDPITGQLRDPKATPPGCGVQLSWSNVKWASPSIFYKFVGSNTWNHLYQIPCKLNGRVCSGSINTDEILPELAPINGVQFKLLQFNSSNSGLLSPATSITTGHRYADAYEFDDGSFRPLRGGSYELQGLFSTVAEIGVIQHNHNFHSPASYDSDIDIDTLQVPVSTEPGGILFSGSVGFNDGKILSVTVLNMVAGLNIGIDFKCVGGYREYVDGAIGEPEQFEIRTGTFDFINDPTDSIIIDPVTGDKTINFRVTDETRKNNPNPAPGEGDYFIIPCIKNQIELTRLSGTPSENLTYSVVVNDPSAVVSPNITIAKSVCSNKYCIRLLGSNFDATASVQVRENVNGSGIIETYAGHDIYNRRPINGDDRIQFPIRDLDQQDKFNSNGLCFKVINSNASSNGTSSNEKCFVRPVTAEQPPFMGKVVESYNANQDKEYTSYVVGGAGSKLKIWGNVWKKIASDYTVTPSTVLKFEFRSTHQQAEINGVGFIMDGATTVSKYRAWQVYGTQNWPDNQEFNDYVGSGQSAQWKQYIIPIGETFTGKISDIVFMADEDSHVGQNIVYKNPVLYEVADQYDDVPARRAYSDDYEGDAVGLFNGITQAHNFHDSGDQDWTMVWSPAINTIRVNTEIIGNNADTSLYVYKVTSVVLNPDYPGQNRFIINDMQLVASDTSIGSSSTIFTTEVNYLYVMKTVSRNANFGAGTEYEISLNFFNEDEYDNVSIRGYTDDYEGDAVGLFNATTQIHNFHDSGDQDWSMVWSPSVNTINVSTQMLGNQSDTKLYIYKVTGVILNPAYPGQNRFIINDMQLVGSDTSIGNSSVNFTTGAGYLYVMKTVSRNNNFGAGTEYNISLNIQ